MPSPQIIWPVEFLFESQRWPSCKNFSWFPKISNTNGKKSIILSTYFLLLFSRLVVSNSLWPQGLQHNRLPCPSPTPEARSNSCPSDVDAIQPSHPLFPLPPAFNLFQHQGLFQWVSSLHQATKVLEFQIQHQSLQWIFKNDFL